MGSGGQTRKFRTAFTEADDAVLVQWVLHNPENHQLKGNLLFQALEERVSCDSGSEPWLM